MKYTRLTKEQLEELYPEFINFLASQTITKVEWDTIKKNTPQVAEELLDVFSDLIWEGALSRAKYLQNVSAQQLFLFKLNKDSMQLIVVKTNNDMLFTTAQGIDWLAQNLLDDSVELFTAQKSYTVNKHQNIFQLIQQGAEICEGNLFESIAKTIH